MKLICRGIALLAVLFMASGVSADNIWDLQAVDANGEGTHPKVGAAIEEANKVTIQGIALNAPDEILEVSGTGGLWQVYVQAESPDKGGIAVFSGYFIWTDDWCPYPLDIEAGDRIQVVGYVADHNGKVNLNERHSRANEFTVTTLAEDVGMPSPIVIPSIADGISFDQTRAGGGESYQCQWVQLNGLSIESGTWGADQEIVVSDVSSATITLLLSEMGDFDSYSAPTVPFSVVGIFDQEDDANPYHDHYRVWIKNQEDVVPSTAISDWTDY